MITESQNANSVGRAYCLWLLAKELRWSVRILTTRGDEVWAPLASTDFAKDIHKVSRGDLTQEVPDNTDLLLAVKPLPDSFGNALRISAELQLPLLVDIDDPDLEVRTRADSRLMATLRWLRRPLRSLVDLKLRRLARSLPSLVSNPWLQSRYGGTLIPHTRLSMSAGTVRDTRDLEIAFIGTRHPHKGVDVLRSAVASVQQDDARTTLTITDDPPEDARTWEAWVGRTSLAAGIELARHADAVVLPSLSNSHALGQLPVKLVDAMMLGRPVVVSDVDPLPWAVGDAGIVVPAGDESALVSALRSLRDPSLRRQLGSRASRHADDMFSLRVLAPRFEIACQRAVLTAQQGQNAK